MRVLWTAFAVDRASEEASFIARDKPAAAKRWLDGLMKAVDRLASFPLSGGRLSELPISNYRQLIYKSHRVVYRIRDDDEVVILTVRRFKKRLAVDELTRE